MSKFETDFLQRLRTKLQILNVFHTRLHLVYSLLGGKADRIASPQVCIWEVKSQIGSQIEVCIGEVKSQIELPH